MLKNGVVLVWGSVCWVENHWDQMKKKKGRALPGSLSFYVRVRYCRQLKGEEKKTHVFDTWKKLRYSTSTSEKASSTDCGADHLICFDFHFTLAFILWSPFWLLLLSSRHTGQTGQKGQDNSEVSGGENQKWKREKKASDRQAEKDK